MQRIPSAPIEDVTAATMLARLRHGSEVEVEEQLRILADAGKLCAL
jgi:hypothetical protein